VPEPWGRHLTATDLAVRADIFEGLGQPERVSVTKEEARDALEVVRRMIEAAVDRIKVTFSYN
jgi:hypothetical protein